MRDLSLHLLDILDNCITASATRVEILVREDRERDLVEMEISDDGVGMDRDAIARAADPFYTTRPGKRVGMGLALLAQAAREAGGGISIDSRPGGGTRIRASFRLSHPDRKPLGDLDGTVDAMRAAHPELALELRHSIVGGAAPQGGSV